MAIERQISGEMTINKITTEITTRIKGNPASTDNATTVERQATGRYIAGQTRKRKKMTPTTSFWDPQYVEKYQNMTKSKNSKNDWGTAERHHT